MCQRVKLRGSPSQASLFYITAGPKTEHKMDAWITVSFIPATTPYFVHVLSNPDDTTTWTQPVVGWLLQHEYDDTGAGAVPTDSRVVAGAIGQGLGEVLPVFETAWFLGAYPEDEDPDPDYVEHIRSRWAARSHPDPEADPDAEGPYPV